VLHVVLMADSGYCRYRRRQSLQLVGETTGQDRVATISSGVAGTSASLMGSAAARPSTLHSQSAIVSLHGQSKLCVVVGSPVGLARRAAGSVVAPAARALSGSPSVLTRSFAPRAPAADPGDDVTRCAQSLDRSTSGSCLAAVRVAAGEWCAGIVNIDDAGGGGRRRRARPGVLTRACVAQNGSVGRSRVQLQMPVYGPLSAGRVEALDGHRSDLTASGLGLDEAVAVDHGRAVHPGRACHRRDGAG
jgi:hypothetical protein